MRVFAGLPLPEEVKIKVDELTGCFKKDYPRLNYVKPAGLHITIHFFGELNQKQVEQVIKIMDDPILKIKRIKSSLDRIGQFPARGNPRVIFVALAGGSSEIIACRDKFNHLIQPAGFITEDPARPFKPHITIARNKREKLQPGFTGTVPVTRLEFEFEKLVLFKSVLSPNGAEYFPLKTIMFQ